LGGPFGVGRVLLQQFRAFSNRFHSLSNGDEQITNYVCNLATFRQPPNDLNEEVLMVTQLDEERRRLWEMVKANFVKAQKKYKDFVDKFQQEVNFEKGDKVWLNIKKFPVAKRFEPQVLGPYAGPFKVLEKKFPDTYKLELLENLKVHPTFHILLLKLVTCDASRPN
jgi:hypothetical protein